MVVVEVTEKDAEDGPNGDGKSAVATPDGRSRRQNNKTFTGTHIFV